MSSNLSTPSIATPTDTARNSAELGGRVLLAALFLLSGVGKIGAYAATAGYMASMGVPGVALPLVIALEVLGAAAIMLGWRTRIVAFLLAGFTLVTGIVFHADFGDQMQTVMFLKNVSISGAFLLLVAHGAGRYSLDARRAR
ncbi:DoxX family protein [Xanthomonas sp. AmX2]|uniref:DoxX family protein n=1 Tax=Xanthomonas sp. TaxID=29446 RepID=UPI0019820948|nr:DoxX family protein [Xanthomonas sp.]MBN6151020.1 DoxX family protein [Xanthomonas sp.]